MTIAHRELARAGLAHVDEVVLVLPAILPHKEFSGAPFRQRLEMMREASAADPNISIAASEGGLFIEIAAECRAAYGDDVRLTFLCGRDAAERIVGWDYGRPGVAGAMFQQFDLLVSARAGDFDPPEEFRTVIRRLDAGSLDHVSATEVRDRISRGEPWEHLVPEEIRELVRRVYRPNY